MLKLAYLARRVGQSAKLGWQQAHSVLLPLHCIQAEGGAIACTLLLVQRKYPTLVRARLPSGVIITQTPKAYTAAQSHLEAQAANVRSRLLPAVSHDPSWLPVFLQFLVPLNAPHFIAPLTSPPGMVHVTYPQSSGGFAYRTLAACPYAHTFPCPLKQMQTSKCLVKKAQSHPRHMNAQDSVRRSPPPN